MAHKRIKRRSILTNDTDLDPMNAVSNLFDVAMVFSVALMVALVSYLDVAEMLFSDSFTMVKNPGKENMEIVTKEAGEIVRYQAHNAQSTTQNKGKRVGTAYQLENGEIIYIPDQN
ncbi:DUF2149 domain-containing protein [Thalassotalea sp. 1_MG-2023]|uniref:DUF2149 domain-containing protein n=1 Tax=Thalassotalea sp. 1_MG-2023 TaxID=3062680 RepID=UPI0026E12F2C|nr:DUF2149 domain-containing protein [Thalassotalea sp. 1_MG-2023]MDO6426691.1 DUF2149 domain-containing protein [Thalassotalea sp. 1_MG-2023]